jgi:hypothetical protein
MTLLHRVINVMSGLLLIVAGISFFQYFRCCAPPGGMPVTFILCILVMPVACHAMAALLAWQARPQSHQTAIVGLATAAIAFFVWAMLLVLAVEMILRKVPMGPSLLGIGGVVVIVAVILVAAGNNFLLFRKRILLSAQSPTGNL